MIDDFHVAYCDTSELRPLPWLVSLYDFRFGKGLTILSDEHCVIVQGFFEKIWIWTQLSEPETLFKRGNFSRNCTHADPLKRWSQTLDIECYSETIREIFR